MARAILGDIDIYRGCLLVFEVDGDEVHATLELATCYENEWTISATWQSTDGSDRIHTGVGQSFEEALIDCYQDKGMTT